MTKNSLTSVLSTLLVSIGFSSSLLAADDEASLQDLIEIEQLAYCYALGADAIGNGRTEPDPLAAGLEIYRDCFTEQTTFAIWPAGMPFNSLRFPERTGDMPPALLLEGYKAFAAMVNSAFRGAGGGDGYDFVQHSMNNIQIDLEGDKARMTAYLASVHMILGDPGAPTRCRQQANGTYSMHAEKIGGKWLVTSLDLAQIAYDTIISNGKGC